MKDEPIKRLNSKGKWEVDFGFDANGKSIRPTYGSEAKASEAIDAYKREVKKRGEYWASLRPLERDIIVTTLREIKSQGLTIQGVWADHQRWRKDNQQSITTPKAYEDVVTSHKAAQLAAGTGERYAKEVEGVFNRFGQGRMRQNIHEIPANDLQVWLDTQTTPAGKLWSKSTKRTQQGRFSGLWEHAKRKGWVSQNITDRLTRIGKIGFDVRIYDNATVMNILAGAMHLEVTKQIIAPLSLGFFGCMRPEEVESKKAVKANKKGEPPFGWDCIDLDDPGTTTCPAGEVHHFGSIRLELWQTKKTDVRVIRLRETAVKWLVLAQELENPLPPVNERRLVDMVCDLIGLEEWIHDGLRKCCATHLRPIYKNDYDVVKDLGNSVKVLLEHYAALNVSEAVSADYWDITPERVKAYMKTKAWKNVLLNAATKRAQLASETAKSGN
jgi:hypothetical protein